MTTIVSNFTDGGAFASPMPTHGLKVAGQKMIGWGLFGRMRPILIATVQTVKNENRRKKANHYKQNTISLTDSITI